MAAIHPHVQAPPQDPYRLPPPPGAYRPDVYAGQPPPPQVVTKLRPLASVLPLRVVTAGDGRYVEVVWNDWNTNLLWITPTLPLPPLWSATAIRTSYLMFASHPG